MGARDSCVDPTRSFADGGWSPARAKVMLRHRVERSAGDVPSNLFESVATLRASGQTVWTGFVQNGFYGRYGVPVCDLVQTAVSAVRQDAQGYSTKTWETGPLKSEAQGLGLSVNPVCSIWAALYVTCRSCCRSSFATRLLAQNAPRRTEGSGPHQASPRATQQVVNANEGVCGGRLCVGGAPCRLLCGAVLFFYKWFPYPNLCCANKDQVRAIWGLVWTAAAWIVGNLMDTLRAVGLG
jgi:hypothetical protein